MTTVNTDNYTISDISLYFDASIAHASLLATTGGVTVGSPFRTSGRNLGNIVTSEITPDVTYIEHYVSVNGKRKRDKIVANQENISISFTFDEINEANLEKFFLASDLGNNKIAPMTQTLKEGSVSLYVKTDVGTDMVYSVPKAVIRPDGGFSFGDGTDWVSGPMVLDVEYYDSGQYASKEYGVIQFI